MKVSAVPAKSVANAMSAQQSCWYGDEKITFTVRRQAERKVNRVAIHVDPDGRVIVDAPEEATYGSIVSAVKKRSRWISSHLKAVGARLVNVLPREYVSGESLMYLGRRYRLKVLLRPDVPAMARMRGAYIEVIVPEVATCLIRSELNAWYRSRAKEVFMLRLAALAPSMLWVKKIPAMRLLVMKVQWGSCSPAGRLTLNPLLVKAPRECIDYVLMHELCHLQHHNHSPKFYKALDSQMPGWRAIKERLDGMAELLLSG